MAEAPGIGHNRAPSEFALRPPRGYGVSCDWTRPAHRGGRPRRFERYWRILRDGRAVDSFLTKRRAMQALAAYRARAELADA